MPVVGEASKAQEGAFPLVADTRNAGFAGHKDVWQNPQEEEEEESDKPHSAVVAKSAPRG